MQELSRPQIRFTPFFFIVAAFAIYAALFIFHSSVIFSGKRYFTLFEDGMISMRYARHLAEGYGLVWNPGGERIEGFTNFLWMVYMSLFHLLPVSPPKMSLLIQVSGACFLILNLIYVKKIAWFISESSPWVTYGAVFLSAFYLPLNLWSLMGMEVSVLTFLVTFCIWKTMESKDSPIVIYFLLGCATLVRIDAAGIFIAMLLFHRFTDRSRRSDLLAGLFLFLLFTGGQTVFRLLYFGDPLPNTYYLKMTGYPAMLRIARGAAVGLSFIVKNWFVFLIAGYAVYRKHDRDRALLALTFLIQLAYSVYVGGDAWEEWGGSNRFLSIAICPVFILFCLGARELLLPVRYRFFSTQFTNARIAILTLIALLSLNAYGGPSSWLECLMMKPVLIGSPQKSMIALAVVSESITHSHGTVATALSGIFPYFYKGPVVDLLGKSDRVIAHEPAHMEEFSGILAFYPGHMKWDYYHSVEKLKPDVIGPLWTGWGVISDYLKENYLHVQCSNVDLYLRKSRQDFVQSAFQNAKCTEIK